MFSYKRCYLAKKIVVTEPKWRYVISSFPTKPKWRNAISSFFQEKNKKKNTYFSVQWRKTSVSDYFTLSNKHLCTTQKNAPAASSVWTRSARQTKLGGPIQLSLYLFVIKKMELEKLKKLQSHKTFYVRGIFLTNQALHFFENNMRSQSIPVLLIRKGFDNGKINFFNINRGKKIVLFSQKTWKNSVVWFIVIQKFLWSKLLGYVT